MSARSASPWAGFVLVACLALSPFGRAASLTDATGTKVVLPDRPARIVTLAPSLAELAADVLGEDLQRIVGVSEYTDYPPALSKVPTVGSYARFSLEKVLSLKPDLVLATLDGNPRDEVVHLRDLKLPVVVVATETLAQVEESMRLVGRALGDAKRGEQMARQLGTGVENVRSRVAKSGAKPRVLLQIGDDPLVVVGKGSFLHEMLELVGAENVYGDSPIHYPKPALEDVVRRDPDAIIVLALGRELAPFHAMAGRWAQHPKMKAVTSRRVRVLQGDPVLRPSLRLLEGLSKLERAVHERK